MQFKRIVITGMGAITPLGNSITEYWNNLRNGVSGADFITLFDASKFKTRFACEIKGFDPTNFLERKEARKLDRFTQTGYRCRTRCTLSIIGWSASGSPIGFTLEIISGG